jgi:hypothetical protein
MAVWGRLVDGLPRFIMEIQGLIEMRQPFMTCAVSLHRKQPVSAGALD